MLKKSRIDYRYMNLVKRLYFNATIAIRVFDKTNTISIERGNNQGDIIFPKLFTKALGGDFRTLD